ncbi:putative glycerol-3-phosphate transporter 1 [Ananas comosus]|uniref:Putative glycerol-3-phosphate transporter 1 n=1 Tax=Ananas comosus TaxID=4615 RepID=A0A199VT92_ANACO|nr:putative glycerol-3-phosphate transporter 1 [Ananas comosus]
MAKFNDAQIKNKPPGFRIFECVTGKQTSRKSYQTVVLLLTFVAYTMYHATRKTTSVVKGVLDPETAKLGFSAIWRPRQSTTLFGSKRVRRGWAPFDGSDGTAMLGEIDVAFLAVYSFGMYFAGHLGDRIDLRILLTIGMLGTGVFTSLFGVGYWLDVHSFVYFLVIQMVAGMFQSTGWPSVVAVVGNWFGKRKRGLIMGIWNAHTSVGNISGSLIASALLKYGWGWSFVVPGLMMCVAGILVFLFLPTSPEVAGVGKEEEISKSKEKENGGLEQPLLGAEAEAEAENKEKGTAVGFFEAWRIPGVMPFALCLFFAKLVAYTFLYWLPFYISHTPIGGVYLSDSTAGTLSTLFDVGGVLGGILAGHISDSLDARAITAASFMYCAIPALFLYRVYGSVSLAWNISLMFIVGMIVNGPYALITTAVSADLGTHGSLQGNSRALATVTAIIDGTGSVGAAIGPLLTGYISARSWGAVFTMLMAAALLAGLLLTKLVVTEVRAKMSAAVRAETVLV